jgi:hypothetical protein
LGHLGQRERWIWDADIAGSLVGDEIGLRRSCTSDPSAIVCKLLTDDVGMGLRLLILWWNTLEAWVLLMCTNFPGIASEERKWEPLQRLNTGPRRCLAILTTASHRDPALVSAFEPILVVTMPDSAETFKTVIDVMTHETNFILVNLLHAQNVILTHEHLNTIIDSGKTDGIFTLCRMIP